MASKKSSETYNHHTPSINNLTAQNLNFILKVTCQNQFPENAEKQSDF